MMKYTLTEQAVKKASEYYANQVQGNLKAKHTRTKVRANWQKVGGGWQPINVKKSKFRGNLIASGNLYRSVKPLSNQLEFGVQMDWYGEMIRVGRKPMGKVRGGKGIPIDKMSSWAKMKGLKARDVKTGQILKQTESNKKAMSFMMNRKVKYFGIEGVDFIKYPRLVTTDRFKQIFTDTVKQDIINNLR